jgi:hypothetical protein
MKSMERGDALLRTAQAIGANAQNLQLLQIAANDAEVGFNELTKKLTEFQQKGMRALEGNIRLNRAFAELGVSTDAFRAASPDAQLEMVARGFAHASDRGRALNAVMTLMGTDTGPEMLKLLRDIGEEGLQGIADKSGAARRVLEDWELKALADMRKRIRGIGDELELLSMRITAWLASGEIQGAMVQSLEAYAVFLKERFGEVLTTLAIDFPKEFMIELSGALDWMRDGLILAAKAFALNMAQGLDEPIQRFNRLMDRIPGWREGMKPQLPGFDTASMQADIDALQARFMQGREGYIPERLKDKTLNQTLLDMLATSPAQDRFNSRVGESFASAQVEAAARVEPIAQPEQAIPEAVVMTDQLREALEQLQATWGDFETQMARGLTGALKGGISDLTQGISGLIQGTRTWGEMWQNVGSGIINQMVEIGVQMIATKVLGAALRKADATETVATEATKTPVLATNAGLAAAGSWGSSALIGLGVLAAAMAVTKGFASGGYTGQGGTYEPAGVVHRGEYVFDAASTRRIGVEQLEALRFGLPGFSVGGAVAYRGPTLDTMAASGGGGTGPVNLNVAVVDSRRKAGRELRSREGQKAIVDIARRRFL